MQLLKKIVISGSLILAAYITCLSVFSHTETDSSVFTNRFIQTFLFLITLFIVIREKNVKNRYIFINFLAYFFVSFGFFVADFVGKAFWGNIRYAAPLFFQYLMLSYTLLLAVAVVYLVIDLLFRHFETAKKYLITSLIVGSVFTFYFHSFFNNPMYLYSTEEAKQVRGLYMFLNDNKGLTNPVEIANRFTLQSWENGAAVGDLYPEQNLKRIEELLPYVESNGSWVIFWKPLYLGLIYIDVMLVFFALLFFGYQYKKDPPQGAYMDKIMFIILLLCSMDILHCWSFVRSIEWGSFMEVFSVGQWITVFAELVLAFFFALRLQFITSVKGEFYESELAAHPAGVTRWRDGIDNVLLRNFFGLKLFHVRLFEHNSKT
jgi:hypothetical protein